jgi:acylphosphatase
MVKMRVIVKGTVQGVGYRALVKFYASQLGIKGLVRNLTDGHVEIFCEGLDERIDQLVKHIDIKSKIVDPSNPNVERIERYQEGGENYSPAWKEYDGFEIDYGNQKLTALEKEALETSEYAKLQFWYLRNEVQMLRTDTNENFNQMAIKYGSISKDLKSTKKEIKGSLKETKDGIQGAIEDLPEKLKKALIEGFKEYFEKER